MASVVFVGQLLLLLMILLVVLVVVWYIGGVVSGGVGGLDEALVLVASEPVFLDVERGYESIKEETVKRWSWCYAPDTCCKCLKGIEIWIERAGNKYCERCY